MTQVQSPGLRAARAAAYENARPEVQELIPATARRVLDLGCASGALGAALKARPGAPEVVGVELDPVYAERARERLDRVLEADLDELATAPARLAELGRFDCLVAADVLEHLRDPWGALAAAVEVLRPGGTAVLSVPNVRYWETFWQLLRGSWPRRSEGIFDRDHLRWFTVADARALATEAGLEVTALERQIRLRPSRPASRPLARALAASPVRGFFTFQALVVAKAPGPDE